MIAHLRRVCLLAALLSPLLAMQSAQALPVGSLTETAGTVFVVSADGKKRLVATGSSLEKGDTIQTSKDSSAKVRYIDGSEMFIRPTSTLVVQDFHFDEKQPEKDSFILGLVRGGLRQVTGAIGKRGNQDAYRLTTPTSTMGIRGTDFTARLCQGNDCGDGKKAGQAVGGTKTIVARVVDFKGQVHAVQSSGLKRDLTEDGRLFVEDLVEVGSQGYASILFTDETRIVVPANSSFRIADYRFATDKPAQGKSSLDMVRGSLRVVTGLIGKANPGNVSLRTGTATIGIRGTSFDLACVAGNLPDPEQYAGDSDDKACGGGLFTLTRDGVISVTNQLGQTQLFQAGQASYVGGPEQSPVPLRSAPGFFERFSAPPPEGIRQNVPDVFGGEANNEAGLYVTVSEGKVVIMQAGKSLFLSEGESGFASANAAYLQRLILPPAFLSQDQRQSQQSLGFKGCRM